MNSDNLKQLIKMINSCFLGEKRRELNGISFKFEEIGFKKELKIASNNINARQK